MSANEIELTYFFRPHSIKSVKGILIVNYIPPFGLKITSTNRL